MFRRSVCSVGDCKDRGSAEGKEAQHAACHTWTACYRVLLITAVYLSVLEGVQELRSSQDLLVKVSQHDVTADMQCALREVQYILPGTCVLRTW